MVAVAFHLEDGNHNGIRISHIDGVRFALEGFGVDAVHVIDKTEDRFHSLPMGWTRHASLEDFVASCDCEIVVLETADGTKGQPSLSFAEIEISGDEVFIVGTSGGFSSGFFDDAKRYVHLTMPHEIALEPREALTLMVAEAWQQQQ